MPKVVIAFDGRLNVIAQDREHLALGTRSVVNDRARVPSELKQTELTPSAQNVIAFAY